MKIWKLLGLAALVTAAATVLLTTTTASAGGKEEPDARVVAQRDAGPRREAVQGHRRRVPEAAPGHHDQGGAAAERAVQDQDPDRAAVGQPAGRVPELGRRRPRRPAEGRQGGRPDEVRQAVDQEHRRHGCGLAGERQAVRGPVQRRRRRLLVQQAALQAGGSRVGAEDMAAVPRRRRQAQAGGDHADRHRQQGRVAGCVLLGLSRHEALQQGGDAVVGGHVQLPQLAAGRRRASTSSSCSTQGRSRTGSWRRRRSRARRAPPGWSRTARRRWSSRDTGTQG